MKKNLLSLAAATAVILFGYIPYSYAVRAKGLPIEVAQPDGSKLTIVQKGDEHSHIVTTIDGYPLLNSEEGGWQYARIDSSGELVATGVLARNAESRTTSEKNILSAVSNEEINRAMSVSASNSRYTRFYENGTTRGPGLSETTFPLTGKQKGLVILVEFSDVKFNSKNEDGYNNVDSHSYFSEMLNKDGFSTYGATGSAREWFIFNSHGLFEPEFDVYGPVTLPNRMSYYGGNDRYGDDKAAWQMVTDACDILNPDVEFSQYDRDGDGYIDNVFVFYAGYGEADSSISNTVWPHSWDVRGATSKTYKYDGVIVGHYACSNETDYTTGMPDGIGTFVHEFSHVLGLPDLYCTDYSEAFTPDSYSVMDYGPYNNNGRTPPNYSSYERYAVGWMEPQKIMNPGDFTLENLADSNFAYIVPTEKANEYFLLENRQKTGWDKYIPGHGMLVWHIDFVQSIFDNNIVNNNNSHQYVDLLEADNRQSNYNRAGDTFPGSSNVTKFSSETTPALKSWAGKPIDLELSNIREENGNVLFHASMQETGINMIETAGDGVRFTISGAMLSTSDDDNYSVYSVSGEKLGEIGAGRTIEVPKGIIIVKGNGIVKKLIN